MHNLWLMLAAQWTAVARSSKNVFMMDVCLWRTCGTPFSRHHVPPPDHSSWKWSSHKLQTVLTLLWRTNAFLGTFVIPRLRIVHQSPFASITTNHFAVFLEAFYSGLKQSIQKQKPEKMCAPRENVRIPAFSRAKIVSFSSCMSTRFAKLAVLAEEVKDVIKVMC